jgi:uncharacterized membrane protein
MNARFLKGFIVSFVVIFISDYLWHTLLFANFYNGKMGAMIAPGAPMLGIIILLEVLAAAGVAWFVLGVSKNMMDSLCNGAFLGVLTIGSVNLLNHAFFQAWDLELVLIDVLWGVLTFALAGAIAFIVTSKW